MARIIDLGNGYGRVEGYGSEYASLTFPLTLYEIRRLHAMEVIDDAEAQAILSKMGYSLSEMRWYIALGRISIEQWKEKVHGLGTI